MYIYPENLQAKAKLFLWELRDLAAIGVGLLLSTLLLAVLKTFVPFVFAASFAFLSIRIDGFCVLDFLKFGFRYFVTQPRQYEWRAR